jgi:GT2 family glycosyltransferase
MVDNHSTDNTIPEAQAVALEMHVLINSHNTGFAGALNQAFKVAEGDLVVILNPDIIVTPGSFDKLAQALGTHGVGAACGLLLNDDRLPQKGFTVRRFPTIGTMLAEVLLVNRIWPGNPWNVRYRCLDLDYEKSQEVEQPAGACLAIKRRAWTEIGGFDEGFFPVWFEDVDFCLRLRSAGWKILYCPDALFIHEGGHSVNRVGFRDRQCFWYRNLLRYFAKHHRPSECALLRISIAVGLSLRALLSLVGFRPSDISVAEALGAYGHAAWNCAITSQTRSRA